MMNRLTKSLLPVMAIAAALLMGSTDLLAQAAGGGGGGGGGRNRNRNNNQAQNPRDPAQMAAQRMERYRQQLEVTSDDEWKVLQPRVEKLMQAQREMRFGGFGGNPRGGGNNPAPADAATNNPGRGNRFGADANPEMDALQKAVDAKASSEELKAKLGKALEAMKQKEANLIKAQDDLRKLLSVRQESIAVLIGLLRR